MTINTNRLLSLLGFCILTTSVFAQTTTSASVITPKTKVVETPLIPVVTQKTSPIITDNLVNFVIEDDIMKEGESDNDASHENFNTSNSSGNASTEAGQLAAVKALQLEKNINIFPLPATNYFNVSIEDNSIDNIMLVNGSGQVVFRQVNPNQENTIRVETNQLAKGIYFVVLNTSNGRISKSILVQ